MEKYNQMITTDTGSLVCSKFPKTNTSIYTKSPRLLSTLTTDSINRYSGLPSPYEKEPMPVPQCSASNGDCVPPNATVVDNNDVFPSHIYHSNKFFSDADKLQECYPHVGVIMSPKNYFGHIRIKRYDFTNEEPYTRKENVKAPCPVHGSANRDEQEANLEVVDTRSSEEKNNDNLVYSESQNQHREQNQEISPYAADDNQMFDMRDISNGAAAQHRHLQNRFHWPGYSQHNNPYSDATFSVPDDLERLMGIMNSHYTSPSLLPMTPKPTLPGIGSFASQLQYMVPNPFFPPILYPGNFDSSLVPPPPPPPPPPFLNMQSKFHPFANSQYYWMQERSRDLAASIYPTVIRPKSMERTPMFAGLSGSEPQIQSSMPHHLPYPNPAAMFRAANLSPPFYLSRRDNITSIYAHERANGGTLNINNEGATAPSIESTPTSVIKTLSSWNSGQSENQNDTSFYSQPSTGSSQIPLNKADNTFSYTIAADPSDVMTYLPNTSTNNCDEVEPTESEEEDEMYIQGDCDDGVFYAYRESFSEVNERKEVKKSVPPSRKSHVCEICGKTYARAFTLKTHQRIHTGEKPYKCKVCQRSFAQGSGLESHMRIHTGEKPYKCPVCYRAFSHSSAVKSHLRTHTGEKPFQCHLCGKYFGDQSTVKKHTRVHTGEKPFKCLICNFTFTQVGNMNKHLKNVHGDKSV